MNASAPPMLTPEHLHELVTDSAILPEVLAEEDIRSVPSSLGLPTPDRAFQHPNTHKGQYFGIWGETDKQDRPIDLGPGLWFGTRDVHGRLSGQIKPAKSRTAFNGHTVKYETCRGTRPSFAVPARCRDGLVNSMCDVFFTEGYKKALALASAGACAISLAGVDSWLVKPDPNNPVSDPVEDFDAVNWRGRMVWIVYDSDAVTKTGVQYAEKRLTRELESRGAIVMVIRIPHASDGSKRGIDDYFRDRLAAGVSREDALRELKTLAIAELQDRLRRRADSTVQGGDGEETCRRCAPLAEQAATTRAENQLLRNGPVPAQEAAFLAHLVREADLARTEGKNAVSLFIPKDAEKANVSKATVTRVLNKLREADEDAIPYTVVDDWRGGKLHVKIAVPSTIGDQPWSPRRAYLALSRAQFGDGRKKQGGSAEAVAARWNCPDHPDNAVIETTTKYYRCDVEDCRHGWTDHPVVRRIPGANDPIQVECGDDEPVTMYGATFETVASRHPLQDDASSIREEQTHSATGQPPARLIPAPFVSLEDAELAAGPRYQGTAPPPEAPAADAVSWRSPRWQPPATGTTGGAA